MQHAGQLGARCSKAWPPNAAGGAAQAISFPFNTGRFGNALAIWLGIRPAELFLYTFLPPMLLDASMRLDWFLFRKVLHHHLLALLLQAAHYTQTLLGCRC